jgi:hypothetical protein
MNSPKTFALPATIEPSLDPVLHYWSHLKRGGNDVPFADDVNLPDLRELAKDVFLLETFEGPLRFRLDIIGERIAARYGNAITGKFIDEVEMHAPFESLPEQCTRAVRGQAPTYYRNQAARYARLALPLWGNGRVEMLLVAVINSGN